MSVELIVSIMYAVTSAVLLIAAAYLVIERWLSPDDRPMKAAILRVLGKVATPFSKVWHWVRPSKTPRLTGGLVEAYLQQHGVSGQREAVLLEQFQRELDASRISATRAGALSSATRDTVRSMHAFSSALERIGGSSVGIPDTPEARQGLPISSPLLSGRRPSATVILTGYIEVAYEAMAEYSTGTHMGWMWTHVPPRHGTREWSILHTQAGHDLVRRWHARFGRGTVTVVSSCLSVEPMRRMYVMNVIVHVDATYLLGDEPEAEQPAPTSDTPATPSTPATPPQRRLNLRRTS